MTERSTGWKSEKKMHIDSKVSVRLKKGTKKSKKTKTKKNGDRSSNRRRLFFGLSIKAISTD